jgi:hypothetical protein
VELADGRGGALVRAGLPEAAAIEGSAAPASTAGHHLRHRTLSQSNFSLCLVGGQMRMEWDRSNFVDGMVHIRMILACVWLVCKCVWNGIDQIFMGGY